MIILIFNALLLRVFHRITEAFQDENRKRNLAYSPAATGLWCWQSGCAKWSPSRVISRWPRLSRRLHRPARERGRLAEVTYSTVQSHRRGRSCPHTGVFIKFEISSVIFVGFAIVSQLFNLCSKMYEAVSISTFPSSIVIYQNHSKRTVKVRNRGNQWQTLIQWPSSVRYTIQLPRDVFVTSTLLGSSVVYHIDAGHGISVCLRLHEFWSWPYSGYGDRQYRWSGVKQS